jgi:hypothetical protein
MKTGWMAVLWMVAASVQAGDVGGPNGGRLLDNEPPRAEFLVNAERRVEIRFYDEGLYPVAPAGQVVSVIAEAPGGKARLELQRAGDAWVSKGALPEGDGYQVIVQIQADAAARPRNFRVPLHLEICEGCQRAEYACTCDHAGEDGHGHTH